MTRKGVSTTTTLSVVTFLVVLAVASIGIQKVMGLDEVIRKETIGIPGSRLESAVHMAGSTGKSRIELEFRDEYRLGKDSNGKFISYKVEQGVFKLTSSNKAKYYLEPPVDFSLADKDVKTSTFCVRKDSGITLEPGECS